MTLDMDSEETEMNEGMNFCAFYDKQSFKIKGFWPTNLDEDIKTSINVMWKHPIQRKILITLSENDALTTPELKAKVGHSMSTLHENLSKLETAKLIQTEMSYVKNKKKIIKPLILFVTQNATMSRKLKGFLNKGLWVDSKKSKQIIQFLNDNPNKYFSIPEISLKTKIPADEVTTLLKNWESQITRAFSDFMKPVPFEKKVMFKSKKNSK